MITQKIIKATTKFASSQMIEYPMLSKFHFDLANNIGQQIALKVNANKKIVLMGTMLMDVEIGRAMKLSRLADHINMGVETSKKFLSQFKNLSEDEIKLILGCINQHHGSKKFGSLEAEVVCNADCYRFASVRGMIGGLLSQKSKSSWEDQIKLFDMKADEKFNALTFDFCKKELEPQYKVIKEFIRLSFVK